MNMEATPVQSINKRYFIADSGEQVIGLCLDTSNQPFFTTLEVLEVTRSDGLNLHYKFRYEKKEIEAARELQILNREGNFKNYKEASQATFNNYYQIFLNHLSNYAIMNKNPLFQAREAVEVEGFGVLPNTNHFMKILDPFNQLEVGDYLAVRTISTKYQSDKLKKYKSNDLETYLQLELMDIVNGRPEPTGTCVLVKHYATLTRYFTGKNKDGQQAKGIDGNAMIPLKQYEPFLMIFEGMYKPGGDEIEIPRFTCVRAQNYDLSTAPPFEAKAKEVKAIEPAGTNEENMDDLPF